MPYDAEILVVGCGNILFKDDGFGPEVIKALEEYFKDREKPDNVMFIDAGTGGPHFVFSLPHEEWKKMIVVDVVEFNAEPEHSGNSMSLRFQRDPMKICTHGQ